MLSRPLLLTVVLLETVAVIALAGLWWSRAAGPPPEAGVRVQTTDSSTPAVRRADAGETPPAASAQPRREEVGSTADGASAAPGDIVLHGLITTTDGSAPPEDPTVGGYLDGEYRGGDHHGGHYALPGLAPGPFTLRILADRFAVYAAEHELSGDPVQRIDVALVPAHRVRVFVEGSNGDTYDELLQGMGLHWGLHVIATEGPLAGNLPLTDNATVGRVGIARFRSPHSLDLADPPPNFAGELWLDRPPPANAALLLRHVMLAQQPIAPGQGELTFTLDRERFHGRMATVTLRLVDGVTGEPLHEGAHVSLGTAQGGGARGRPDADGRVVVENVMPGLAAMTIGAGGDRESVWDLVRVPPGASLDLGEVVLHPAVKLRGRLLDERGDPVAGKVRWTNLATLDFPRELVNRRSTRADGDGKFEVWQAGPHRYVLVGAASDGRLGYTVADARAGPVTNCEIRVGPTCSVTVTVPDDTLESFVATLRDADGVPVAARRIEPRWPWRQLSAPPGEYRLEVHGSRDALVCQRDLSFTPGGSLRVEVGR